jgi:hypothetical protein
MHEEDRPEGPSRQRSEPIMRQPRDLAGEQLRRAQELHRQRHQRRTDDQPLHILDQGMALGRWFSQDQHGSTV